MGSSAAAVVNVVGLLFASHWHFFPVSPHTCIHSITHNTFVGLRLRQIANRKSHILIVNNTLCQRKACDYKKFSGKRNSNLEKTSLVSDGKCVKRGTSTQTDAWKWYCDKKNESSDKQKCETFDFRSFRNYVVKFITKHTQHIFAIIARRSLFVELFSFFHFSCCAAEDF